MIAFIPVIIALAINALFVGLRPGPDSLLAAAVSLLCATAALVIRRFYLLVIAMVISGFGYLSYMLSGMETVQMWLAVLFGCLAFLQLEIGYDAISCMRSGVRWRSYRHRVRYISTILLVFIVLVVVFITFSYNLLAHISDFPGRRLLFPALFVLGVIPAVALGIVVRGSRRR
ncbi:MAG: hypothetical protein CMN78_02055 [Spirochaetales bacterium]|nr:hypothetical protein [Spirochaetales bacterium]